MAVASTSRSLAVVNPKQGFKPLYEGNAYAITTAAMIAMNINDTVDVHLNAFKESKKLSGATTKNPMTTHEDRCNQIPVMFNSCMTSGIKSPITIKYDVATPKHFSATAISINRAYPGATISATA